jgi:hypothetical protein
MGVKRTIKYCIVIARKRRAPVIYSLRDVDKLLHWTAKAGVFSYLLFSVFLNDTTIASIQSVLERLSHINLRDLVREGVKVR